MLVSSMVCMGRGSGFPAGGPVVLGQPARVLGARIARQGIAVAVREGERYALAGPNGVCKALVVVALLGAQAYASRNGGSLLAEALEASILGSGAAASAGGM